MVIQPSERQDWLSHPVTKEFLAKLQESRQETLENWAREKYIGESAEQSGLRNAKALGGVGVLDQVIELIQDIGSEDYAE